MKEFLINFREEYYCQGYEWAWFTRFVKAHTFEEACEKIKNLKTRDWEFGTPELFKNQNI
jgi:hypothetical protein